MNKKILTLALFLTMSATFAAAQQHPNHEKGFQAEKVFQFGSLDSVNIFNGNVMVTMPIGQRYTVNAGLSYAFNLNYNGKLWDYTYMPGYQEGQMLTKSIPARRPNAGSGWMLTLGRLFPPGDPTVSKAETWAYESPDGADHLFYKKAQWDDGDNLIDPNIFYTRDNSYLRMRKVGSSRVDIEFPDGVVHEFELSSGKWRLREMRDQFKDGSGQPRNWVRVAYPSTSPSCVSAEVAAWVVTDSQSRRTDICFTSQNYDDSYRNTISEVVTRGFQGDAGAAPEERYMLNHTPDHITRARVLGAPYIHDSNTLWVPTLTSLQLPDGSLFEFKYWSYTSPWNVNDGAIELNLEEMKYPTGGKLYWKYTTYEVVGTPNCGTSWANVEWISRSTGVRSKEQHDENGLVATWHYQPETEYTGITYECMQGQDPTGHQGEIPGEQFKVTVISPDNDKVIHYFSVWPGYNEFQNDSSGGFKTNDYSLPFTRRYSSGGRFLSTESFDCIDAVNGNCPSEPLRRAYLTYERDDVWGDQFDSNRRMAGTRTVYVKDGNRWVDTEQTDYDGHGHYRRATTTGNFGSDVTKSAYTNYNPGSDAKGRQNGQRYLGTGAPWITGKYDETRLESGSTVFSRSHACFTAQGFLQATRTLSNPQGGTVSSNDLIANYLPDLYGNVAQEDWFGGDTQDVSNILYLCSNYEGSRYRRTHVFEKGTLKASYVHSEASGRPVFLQTVNNIIDGPTGLVWKSTDPAGIVTTYTYGSMLRLSSVSTPGSATSSYTYKRAGEPGYPLATVLVSVASADSFNNSQQTIEYDGLGRVKYETRQMPNGMIAKRETRYDGSGRRSHLSEWETTPSHFTQFFYDSFGRPAKVSTPDNKEITTLWTDDGIRELKRKSSIGTVFAGGSTVNESQTTVTEVYDIHGRLKEIREADNYSFPNTEFQTLYTYDLADRLTYVQLNGIDRMGWSTGQWREFVYDTRGFLDYETHPESGTTDYRDYDAKGHALMKWQGPTRLHFDLKFEYDAAERLTKVWSRNPYDTNNFRISKEFVYDTANNNGYSKAKLVQTTRHNYNPGLGDVIVKDFLTYGTSGADAGRATQKRTLIEDDGSTVQELQQSFSYNDLGQQTTQWYPTCISTVGCGPGATTAITRGYEKGYLESVSGYVDSITYHPNGLTNQIVHNGTTQVVDTQTYETANGMARPKSISFGSATSCTSPTFTQPADRGIAPGTSTTLTTTAGGTGSLTVKWYQDYAAYRSNYVGSGSSFTTPNLYSTTRYWFEVINACGIAESGTITVSMCSEPVLNGPPPVTIASGTSTVLSVTATGGAPFTYAWYEGSTLLQNGSSNSYQTPILYADTTYRVRVTNACGAWSENTVLVTVSCTAPLLNGPAPVTVPYNTGTTLTVSASGGSTPYTYQWFIGTTPVGTNSPNHPTGNLTSTTTYRVRVTSACGAYDENTVVVTVGCTPPLLSGPAPVTIAPNTGTTLTVTVSGGATPYTYQWFIGTTPVGTNSPSHPTGNLTATTTYRVRVTSACGEYAERTVTVTVAAPPSNLAAASTSTTRVDLSWSASTSVSYYEVERKTGAGAFVLSFTPTTNAYPDQSVTAGNAYAYRVRAVHTDGTRSAYTNVDVASTHSFSAIVDGVTVVVAAHANEIRAAVASLRTVAGLGAYAWTDPTLQPGLTQVRAIHPTQVRTAINEARTALGVAPAAFTDPTVVAGVTLVRGVHLRELQAAVQ